MREIKFRAWDNIFKRFSKQVDSCASFTDEEDGKLNIAPNIQLLQYIGLKDKNKEEIYEGDIAKYDFDGNYYRVEFLNGEFLLRRKLINIENVSMSDCDYGKEIEVIGNIYENPELLES